jgi:diguanylate cyclase (GGDEF)-like protein/PAS domain S-box-containing protein/putative nucleotidyltransferase with HDIG domain
MQQNNVRLVAGGYNTKKKIVMEKHPGRAPLALAYKRLKAIINNSFDVVVLLDASGEVFYKSPSERRILGYASCEIIGHKVFDYIHQDDLDCFTDYFETTVCDPIEEKQSVEMRVRCFDGTWIWTEATLTNTLDDRSVNAIVLNLRDISETKRMAAEVQLLEETDKFRSQRDSLTEVYNHREFHRLFDEAIKKADGLGQPLTVLLLDLSNFTFINDVYGHVIGDEMLKLVANELVNHKGFVRCGVLPEDLIVARYGGDEFAVILPDVDVEAAIALPKSIADSLQKRGFQPPGDEDRIPVVCAIGAAVYPHDGLTRLQVLAAASERLKRIASSMLDNERANQVRRRISEKQEGFTLLDALLTAVDNKDRYTRRHSEDVMVYASQIAEEMRLDRETRQIIEVAALLHDVGKIGIPDQILRKPGKLTDAEYSAIKQHPVLGAVMVSAVPGFENTLDAVKYHHERWDGKGYPSGKAGLDIPFIARIIAAADAFSAMTTDRPYRSGMTEETALGIIENGAGSQWDPVCAAALVAARRRLMCETLTGIELVDYLMTDDIQEAA